MYENKQSLTTDEKGSELGNKNSFTDENDGFPMAQIKYFGEYKFFNYSDGNQCVMSHEGSSLTERYYVNFPIYHIDM